MSGSASNSEGERLRALLMRPDSILEPDAGVNAKSYLDNLGDPSDLFDYLSNSYVGSTEEIRLMRSLFEEASETDSEPVVQDVVRNLVLTRYDNNRVENLLTTNTDPLQPTVDLIKSPYWRKVIYKLSVEYPSSRYLNFLIKAISEKGLTEEIQHLPATSAIADVHIKVCFDQINKLIRADDLEIEKILPDLIQTASLKPHAYFLAQSILKRLSQEKGGYPLRKIAKELEKGVLASNKGVEFTPHLRNLLNNPPNQVANAILRLPPTPGDVVVLHKTYSSHNPPSPIFLRDPELLNYLTQTIFVPTVKPSQLKEDLRWKYLYLLAFASSAKEINDGSGKPHVDITKVERTYSILRKLDSALSKKGSTGQELGNVIKEVINYIHHPPASMALIFWCRYLLLETNFYEKYFKQQEIPLPHLLLEEIAFQHPLQRQHIFSLFVDNLVIQSRSIAPEMLTAIRKQLLDRIIYLVQLGYVIPILKHMEKNATRLEDESLLFYFVKKVLEMIEPPYSTDFYELMLRLIDSVTLLLESGIETKPITYRFLAEHAPDFPVGSMSSKTLSRLKESFKP